MLFLQLPLKRMTGVGPQNRAPPIDWDICARDKRGLRRKEKANNFGDLLRVCNSAQWVQTRPHTVSV